MGDDEHEEQGGAVAQDSGGTEAGEPDPFLLLCRDHQYGEDEKRDDDDGDHVGDEGVDEISLQADVEVELGEAVLTGVSLYAEVRVVAGPLCCRDE